MAAQEHYKLTLQKKCFTAWQLYLTQTQQLSIIEETRRLTKNKIASFLDAAATGKLWSGRSEGNDLRRSKSFGDVNQSTDSTQKRVVSFMPVAYVQNGIKYIISSFPISFSATYCETRARRA